MQAGKLRRRIKFEEKRAVKDSFGTEMETWLEFATVWGSVEPLSGRELVEWGQKFAEVSTRVEIRYLAGLGPEMRATSGGIVYDILEVIDVDGLHKEMQVMCKTNVS